jgi:hypothetical protein
MPTHHPAIRAFVSQIGEGLTFGQVRVQKRGRGYELRHRDDLGRAPDALRLISAIEARQMSQSTSTGVFRPLKGSPDLPAGWRLEASDLAELDFALGQFYPGSIADWFTVQQRSDAAISYRDYTERQTGMYRLTAMVTDAQARHIARACCDVRFCLKRRLWAVPDLPADTVEEKSMVPCLEPCPVLMEFARKAARIEQEEPTRPALHPEEVRSVLALIEQAEAASSQARQADFADPLNPRRLLLLLHKLSASSAAPAKAGE